MNVTSAHPRRHPGLVPGPLRREGDGWRLFLVPCGLVDPGPSPGVTDRVGPAAAHLRHVRTTAGPISLTLPTASAYTPPLTESVFAKESVHGARYRRGLRRQDPHRFDLVLFAAQRARQISGGAELLLDRDRDKNPVVALREIADELVRPDHSRKRSSTACSASRSTTTMKSTPSARLRPRPKRSA